MHKAWQILQLGVIKKLKTVAIRESTSSVACSVSLGVWGLGSILPLGELEIQSLHRLLKSESRKEVKRSAGQGKEEPVLHRSFLEHVSVQKGHKFGQTCIWAPWRVEWALQVSCGNKLKPQHSCAAQPSRTGVTGIEYESSDCLVLSAQMGNTSLPTLQAFSPAFALPLENVILSCLTRFTVDFSWPWP